MENVEKTEESQPVAHQKARPRPKPRPRSRAGRRPLVKVKPAPAVESATLQSNPEPIKESAPQRRKQTKNYGVPSQKLAMPELSGYALRWFNDTVGRLHEMQQNDWEFVDIAEFGGKVDESVSTDLGTRVSRIVGTNEHGDPLRAYLMKKRREWHEADQKEKDDPLKAMDETIRRGELNDKASDKRYVPKSGIDIQTRFS